jgi:hypothetical protein
MSCTSGLLASGQHFFSALPSLMPFPFRHIPFEVAELGNEQVN